MKTKLLIAALLASAAMIAEANAGGHHGGGGGGGFGGGPHFGGAPPRGGGGGAYVGRSYAGGNGISSFRSMPMRNFGAGNRMVYSGQHFRSMGMYQLSPGNFGRVNGMPRYGNNSRVMQARNDFVRRNGAIANRPNNTSFGSNSRVMQGQKNLVRRNSAVANGANGARQVRQGNALPTNWQNHVAARHASNWHRDWDRSRDHSWHGHHCRFVNDSWVVFDFGYYPWWPYWYPDDYYAYNYYGAPYYGAPSSYDSGAYEDQGYGDQNGYGDQSSGDQTVAAAQEELARQGYYRGQIDGVAGPETSRALAGYQRNHGLTATGYLTADTLAALGIR